MVVFNFFEYLCYFFSIFCYELRRNETERQYLFSFFLGLFQPILPLNEAILAFFNFLNFFAVFCNFKFCASEGRNETIIFIFSLSLPFPSYFGLKWCHNCIFLFFWYFFEIFYYVLGWNETEQQYLLSFFPGLSQPFLALNGAILAFFNFLNFFAIFLEF